MKNVKSKVTKIPLLKTHHHHNFAHLCIFQFGITGNVSIWGDDKYILLNKKDIKRLIKYLKKYSDLIDNKAPVDTTPMLFEKI